ncbi:MAG: SRPBCC domain-containing protein, partial [Actinobacteria bacterium]|nr:SRPBCC domain-containing protein [Actinomycetota bacterium]
EGERSVVAGVYREIDPPRRLRFSWIWLVWKTVVPAETLVTIELRNAGDMTEVTVTHEGFPDAWTRKQHAAGWQATLDCLEPLLRSEKEAVRVLDHHDRVVDQAADGEGEPVERHGVDRVPSEVETDEGREDGERGWRRR